MKIIRRHIFETNSSHGHSWYTNGVAYADTALGEGSWTGLWQVNTNYAEQNYIPYNLKFKWENKDKTITDNRSAFINGIELDTDLDESNLIPVYIWKKTADPVSIVTVSGSTVEIEVPYDETYTMSAISNGITENKENSESQLTVNVIGSKQKLTGFSLPAYTDEVFQNHYMFQWQISTDNFTWYDIIGANNSTYAISYNPNIGTIDVTYYFQCLIYAPYVDTDTTSTDENSNAAQSVAVTSKIAVKFVEPKT